MFFIKEGNRIRVKDISINEYKSYIVKKILSFNESENSYNCILEDLNGNIIEKALNKVNSKDTKEIKSNKDVDWFIHEVPNEEGRISYHTHGLTKYLNYELELNLPLAPEVAQDFINTIVGNILKGTVDVYDGYKDEKIFTCYTLFLVMDGIMHPEEKHYRIIFADENNLLPDDDNCNEMFKSQI